MLPIVTLRLLKRWSHEPGGEKGLRGIGGQPKATSLFFSAFPTHLQVQNRPVKECAAEKAPVIPAECVGLRETYARCKRGQVWSASRIRSRDILLTLQLTSVPPIGFLRRDGSLSWPA